MSFYSSLFSRFTLELNLNKIMTNIQNCTETEFKTSSSPETLISESDVKVRVEKLEKRQRRILAQIQIPYSLEQVWQVLTDYEAFVEFMPNLIESRRLQHSTAGDLIEQVRTKSFMGRNFSARSVFKVKEEFPHLIHYQLVEGEMKAFSGYWRLEPIGSPESDAGTNLIYDFFVLPKRVFPMALVERVLNHDIPMELLAIRQRVADLYDA